MRLAVDKMRDFFRVPVSKLLPYPGLLVPIAYFYSLNNKRQPDNAQMRQISRFFFRAALTRRYSSAVETKINQDLRLMEKIAGNQPVNVANAIPMDNETEEFFARQLMGDFRTGDAFVKAILCILAERGPKRLNDNSPVRLDNSWLHISTSRNYHHFFPKSRVRSHAHANALANIILVDDHLNKRVIGSKMPSEYIGKFQQDNPDIAAALGSHFVSMDDFHSEVKRDDFDKFLKNRAHRLAQVIVQKIDAGEALPSVQMEPDKTATKKSKRRLSPDSALQQGVVILEGWHIPPPGSAKRDRRVAVEEIEKEGEGDIESHIVKFVEECLPDLLVIRDDGSRKSWATHQEVKAVLCGKVMPPEGMQEELWPVPDNIRENIRRDFWTQAPAKNRPGPDELEYSPSAPQSEWGLALMVGDSSGQMSGHICHFPTLSFFRFWDKDTAKPIVREAHRGSRVKNDEEWQALMKEAPQQHAKLVAMLRENPEL